MTRITQKNNSMLKAGGRPTKGRPSPKISIVMTEEMLAQVTKYATDNGITRGEAVRQCIKEALG